MSVRAGKSFDKLLDDPNWKDRALKAEKQLAAVRAETVGWAYGYACVKMDEGIDIRQVEAPQMLAACLKDFGESAIGDKT